MSIVGVAKVETLKGTLAKAQQEAKANKEAADKVAAELKTKQAARCQPQARVAKVEQELKDAILKCVEEKTLAQSTELSKALQEAKEARVESRSACEEIRKAKQIAAGKAFLLQSIFGGQWYRLLTQL